MDSKFACSRNFHIDFDPMWIFHQIEKSRAFWDRIAQLLVCEGRDVYLNLVMEYTAYGLKRKHDVLEINCCEH